MWAWLLSRLRFVVLRRRADADAQRELDAHLGLLIDRYTGQGMTPADARVAAHQQFGNRLLVREEIYRLNSIGWLDTLASDGRYGLRMLAKYPGLTLAGTLALALAIGIGAGWYDFTGELLRPTLPLPEGDRIVEIELRNSLTNEREPRVLHDFLTWRRDARAIEELGAFRTIERNLVLGDAPPEPVTFAEITASAFRLARVPPILGRPLFDADEQHGAPGVVVIGYQVWQQWFGSRADAIGRTLQLGTATMTVVGVMPEGFGFPVNHRLWVPLALSPTPGYEPLEGPPVDVFARLGPGVTHAQAEAEVSVLTEREAVESPQTHEHLRPLVRPYGHEFAGGAIEIGLTHLPVLLVLIIACTNVATLIYARTATREGEISTRYALGASRGGIVAQLFVEALVLAFTATIAGLAAAHAGLKWGIATFYSAQAGALPFWVDPGLSFRTVVYSMALAVVSAALLGVLPALKATGSHVQLANLGTRGSTLRFGAIWTTAIIVQVALTVIGLPPAIGIAHESMRDRTIRAQFPTEEYLTAVIELDRGEGPPEESAASFAERMDQTYAELERRLARESGVVAVTSGDWLPGMGSARRQARVEQAPGAAPIAVTSLWTAAVGRGFFDAFAKPIVAGRDFHDGDRAATARTVIVNEAFSRRYANGGTPLGTRIQYAGPESAPPDPWFEIVGVVRDIGTTPTGRGEAPYVFHAASPGRVYPVVMGVHVSGDPAAMASRVRTIAAAVDPGLRLREVRPLDDIAREADLPQTVLAGSLAVIVALGLFLSAGGIFSLMSVSVARRTREIGLRKALGARPDRLLASIFSRVLVLVGSGVIAGNLVILPVLASDSEANLRDLTDAVLITSVLMLIVGVLACVEPARRAFKIEPSDALKTV